MGPELCHCRTVGWAQQISRLCGHLSLGRLAVGESLTKSQSDTVWPSKKKINFSTSLAPQAREGSWSLSRLHLQSFTIIYIFPLRWPSPTGNHTPSPHPMAHPPIPPPAPPGDRLVRAAPLGGFSILLGELGAAPLPGRALHGAVVETSGPRPTGDVAGVDGGNSWKLRYFHDQLV